MVCFRYIIVRTLHKVDSCDDDDDDDVDDDYDNNNTRVTFFGNKTLFSSF
jgi:hypothetical protein